MRGLFASRGVCSYVVVCSSTFLPISFASLSSDRSCAFNLDCPTDFLSCLFDSLFPIWIPTSCFVFGCDSRTVPVSSLDRRAFCDRNSETMFVLSQYCFKSRFRSVSISPPISIPTLPFFCLVHNSFNPVRIRPGSIASAAGDVKVTPIVSERDAGLVGASLLPWCPMQVRLTAPFEE